MRRIMLLTAGLMLMAGAALAQDNNAAPAGAPARAAAPAGVRAAGPRAQANGANPSTDGSSNTLRGYNGFAALTSSGDLGNGLYGAYSGGF